MLRVGSWKKSSFAWAVAGIVLLLAGSVPAMAATRTVKIGVILPLSGPLAPTGRELRQGIELMVDIVNNAYPELAEKGLEVAKWEGIPGLGGARLEPVFVDSRGDPAVGADLARRLILEQNVVGLMGAYQSAVTKAVAGVTERYGIPFVNADSSSPSLTRMGYRWFWRVTPHDQIFDEDLFNFLDGLKAGKVRGVPAVPKDAITKLAIVAENTEFGTASGDDIDRRLAPERGYQVVQYIKYPANSPDLTSEAIRLASSGADAYLFISYVSDAILFMRTLRLRQAAPKLIWGQDAGFTNPDFVKAIGKDLHGVLTRSLYIGKLTQVKPVAAAVNSLYRQRYGADLVEESARETLGVIAWAYALDRAKSTEPAALQKALDELNVPGDQIITPWKGIQFGGLYPGETHQNIHATGMIGQYQWNPKTERVELEIVYPFESATADVVYPFPGWR
ncbi:ABC transporter substrate-binding protein [Carboxydochorda subterranea]|uniref:ABC transporter substrate-binding protein n=1 Tax=Carboxydichorda subterranea TaxID=3109565 RepID=A0ABZ1BZB9_9FIRM|nr:ABC transporter substrate-binding protein [Limnochorda sp. L945t]WRP17943.1 ABC transporter substrate-binding protein [Limnochorda sp. L945t]